MNSRLEQAECMPQHLVRIVSCWKCYANRGIQFSHSYFQLCKDCMYEVLIHEQTLIVVRLGKDLGNLSKALSLSLCHCHVLRGLWR